jgi:hypothetical protein
MLRKCIDYFSRRAVTGSEEIVLMKGLNFSVTYPHYNLDMECTVNSVVWKLSQTLSVEFRWKIRSMLAKSKSSVSNVTKKELKAMKCLRLNEVIRILQADRGNSTAAMDESKHEDKLYTLLSRCL